MLHSNLLRNGLIAGIIVVSFLLFIQWNTFQERQLANIAVDETTVLAQAPILLNEVPEQTQTSEADIPSAPANNEAIATNHEQHEQAQKIASISVETDTFEILIDPVGGDIVKLALKQYAKKLDTPNDPFVLLNHTQSQLYIAQSGLIGPNGTDSSAKGRPYFSSEATNYQLQDGKDTLVVDLSYQQDQHIITKRYTFTRDSHLITLDYIVDNQSDAPWVGNLYGQIKRDSQKPAKTSMFAMSPYLGGAITSEEKKYQKISFDQLNDSATKLSQQGGWVALIQHYFLSAWIPPKDQINNYYLRRSGNSDYYLFGFTSSAVTIAPGEQKNLSTSFYAGPKIIEQLEQISPALDLTIDYGLLWFIAKPLFRLLEFIHGLVNNWGIAIILLTVLIKLLFFYPSAMSYRSMAKMRKVQPQMALLKERYGDDRQKMSAELMKLYKKEKVNPLGGCLPILIQMPVFIALYWALMESVELRHAPFFLWIEDLSVKDPYFVLPLVMGLTMWIQQKLNPTPPDPMQAKIMQLMPFFFTFLFMMFPAGLVLYWVVNNTLSISQQYVITKNIEKE